MIEGLSVGKDDALAGIVKRLAPRWFVVRNVHAGDGPVLLQPRWAMSFMRGPMTRGEIRRAREIHERGRGGGQRPTKPMHPQPCKSLASLCDASSTSRDLWVR